MTLLSQASGAAAPPLLNETIGDNLRRTVERLGQCDAIFIRHQDIRVTYRQFWDDVSRAARALLAMNIAAGERVGVWSSNRYEWVVVQYATARIGAILVNINPAYLRDELAYALRQSGVRTLFLASRFKSTEYASLLEAARPTCTDLRETVRFDDEWDAFLRRGDSVTEREVEVRERTLKPDDAINIQYTSGTTGFPKGATLTHRNILNNGYFTGIGLGYTHVDRVCVPVPFYHCFGMVLGCLACTSHGACMVVPSETFNPLATLEAIQAERCTSLYGVPTMFRAILEHPEFSRFDVSSLRTGVMAGSPCPIELMREVVSRLHMPEVAIGYGMTETSPLSTLSSRDDTLERRVGTVGRAIPHVEIAVREQGTGRFLPRGEAGEFCARGPHVMIGYWNDEKATHAAIDADGWMQSGDLALMTDEGYIKITGRLKDVIIRGGENIAPREIESVLETHSAVSEVQVIGVPSHRYGEELMAWVKCKPGATITETELMTFCKERMAAFKVPKFWHFADAFPMTVTGKIQKYRLRELAVEMLNLRAVAEEKTA